MKKIKFVSILSVFIFLFLFLTYVYYEKTRTLALENAHTKISELLLNYKAFRTYISNEQKAEVYRLQDENKIDYEYFNPVLMSSTYGARTVNKYYNTLRKEKNQKEIIIGFASDNPRNLVNKATKKQSKILKRFNNGEIKEYSEILNTPTGKELFYAIETKRTTAKCMKCHSDPKSAPKQLVEKYGDINGFYEKVGQIRAILYTRYPLDEDLSSSNNIFLTLTFTTFIIFMILLYLVYIFTKKIENTNTKLNELNKTLDNKVVARTKELDEEKEYIETILDTNSSIIIVTNEEHIVNVNKQFLKFFNVNSIVDFTEKNDCICDFFETLDEKPFSKNKLIGNQRWYEYLLDNTDMIHNVTMKLDQKIHTLIINATFMHKHNEILLTFQDITELKTKEKLLFEQSKLASMGEMIGNIAHQWRQPLSVISTGATGIQVQKKYDLLNDEMLNEFCELINTNAQYLSKTIDDFKNFIKGDRDKTIFGLKDGIDSFLNLSQGLIKNHNINIVLDLQEDIKIDGYKNELTQCLINIFNNAKDALNEKNIEDKYIFISTVMEENSAKITIKDNAEGIPLEVLQKIFEPYFTTKHQSQGTGLGLHMTYNLIVDGMGGTIEANNEDYYYDNKSYTGAKFIIVLPLS